MAEGDRGSFRGRTYFDVLATIRKLHTKAELLDARYREKDGCVDVRLTLRFPSWKAVRETFAS